MSDEVEALRARIRELDQDLVRLAAKRTALAREVGELKRAAGVPIRNYAVEAEVIRLARAAAQEQGIRPDLAEEMMKLLILESLRAQERDRMARAGRDAGSQEALVVGGAGQMGAWFVEFLESKGHRVSVADPRGSLHSRPFVTDVAAEAHRFDLILVATPPSAAAEVLRSLAGRARGLVFDVASLKAPVRDALLELARLGHQVSSLHPMWGPRTELLASKNVLVCDAGVPEANKRLRDLFADTAAHVIELPLDEHDRHMAHTLGLPHALNLVFGHTLAHEAEPFDLLDRLGGPTFRKQAAVSREVARESKDLYHEIQVLNPHTPGVLKGLRRSLDELEASLASREAFRAYMADAERYFSEPAGSG